MKGLVTVARRELEERLFVFLAAAFAATLPFLIPLLPGLQTAHTNEARQVIGLGLAVVFGGATAIAAGASIFSRELAERRTGFYFTRPLSGLSIWFGKVVAGALLVVGAMAILLLPILPLPAGGVFLGGATRDVAGVAALLTLAAVVLFAVMAVAAVAVRTGTAWLAVDLVLVPVLFSALWLASRRFLRFQTLPPLLALLLAALGAALACLLAASAAHLLVGRSDGRRAHGAQSLVLWLSLFSCAAGYELFARRWVSPPLASLVSPGVEYVGGDGTWAVVDGRPANRDAFAAYLVNLKDGRRRRLEGPVRVAEDGRLAVVLGYEAAPGPNEPKRLVGVDLTRPDVEENAWELSVGAWPERLVLSADARLAALLGDGTLELLDLPSGRIRASVRLPKSGATRYLPSFVDGETVRLYPKFARGEPPRGGDSAEREDRRSEILEVNASTRELRTVGRLEIPEKTQLFLLSASPRNERLLVIPTRPRGSATALLDGRTGARIATLVSAEHRYPGWDFLSDGRILGTERRANGLFLQLYDPDGKHLREIRLAEPDRQLRLGWEVAPGVVAGALTTGEDGAPRAWEDRVVTVDLGTGLVRTEAGRLRGSASHGWWGTGVSGKLPAPGSPVTRVFHTGDSAGLVLFDPTTARAAPVFE